MEYFFIIKNFTFSNIFDKYALIPYSFEIRCKNTNKNWNRQYFNDENTLSDLIKYLST